MGTLIVHCDIVNREIEMLFKTSMRENKWIVSKHQGLLCSVDYW